MALQHILGYSNVNLAPTTSSDCVCRGQVTIIGSHCHGREHLRIGDRVGRLQTTVGITHPSYLYKTHISCFVFVFGIFTGGDGRIRCVLFGHLIELRPDKLRVCGDR